MAGGYRNDPVGVAGLAAKFADLQRQINELRSAAGIKSATFGEGGITTYSQSPESRMTLTEGRVEVDIAALGSEPGQMGVVDEGTFYFGIVPPRSESSVIMDNGVFLTGTTDAGDPGTVIINSDGRILLKSGWSGTGARMVLDSPEFWLPASGKTATVITLSTNQLALYGLPTTGSSANLRLDTIGGVWTVGYISSSLRYKQDVEPAEVNPREVIALSAKTWRDRHEVEHDPDTTKRNVGFIAEELNQHPTLRQFVDYDDEGRPDAIQYDRLSVALLAVVKEQDERLAAIEARLDALEGKE